MNNTRITSVYINGRKIGFVKRFRRPEVCQYHAFVNRRFVGVFTNRYQESDTAIKNAIRSVTILAQGSWTLEMVQQLNPSFFVHMNRNSNVRCLAEIGGFALPRATISIEPNDSTPILFTLSWSTVLYVLDNITFYGVRWDRLRKIANTTKPP